LETSANFVETRAGNSRWNPARVSGKCVMGISVTVIKRLVIKTLRNTVS